MPDMYFRNGSTWSPAKKVYSRGSTTWTEAKEGWIKNGVTWTKFFQNEITVTLGASTLANRSIRSFFTTDQWTDTTDKVVVVPAGVETGGLWLNPADTTLWGGKLTIINNGIISGPSGTGGSAGSAGGNGPIAVYFGVGNNTKLFLVNNGTIRGGGGGGGGGGAGGNGSYNTTIRQPTSGYNYAVNSTDWRIPTVGSATLLWGGTTISAGISSSATSFVSGIYTYFRGTNQYSEPTGTPGQFIQHFNVYRTYVQTTATTGGAGGAGGRGDGIGTPRTLGVTGSAGGTNAGTGGTGGNGGTWGNSGSAGSNGGFSGGAGGAGGSAGYYIYGTSRATITNNGTFLGISFA